MLIVNQIDKCDTSDGKIYRDAIFYPAMLCCINLPLYGNTLQIILLDQHNRPLSDAVVEIVPHQALPDTAPPMLSVAQQGLMFTPFVSAVPRGGLVEFPNKDKTRHHVYSFSDAKTFEIELYVGKPEQPVLFDSAGIVVLGCNIHDYMQAYIYVGDSPLLAVTNAAGQAQLSALPSGQFDIKLWHPWQLQPYASQTFSMNADTTLTYQLAVADNSKPTAPKRGFGS